MSRPSALFAAVGDHAACGSGEKKGEFSLGAPSGPPRCEADGDECTTLVDMATGLTAKGGRRKARERLCMCVCMCVYVFFRRLGMFAAARVLAAPLQYYVISRCQQVALSLQPVTPPPPFSVFVRGASSPGFRTAKLLVHPHTSTAIRSF